MEKPRYTVVIQWSDEDDQYVVSLPEWGPWCKTHGATYEEAARNAQEVLEMLLDTEGDADPKPEPKLFHYPGADVIDRPDEPLGSAVKPSGTVQKGNPAVSDTRRQKNRRASA